MAAWTAVCGVLGAFMSVVVNNALFEISLTPFYSGLFGLVLSVLGGRMLQSKYQEYHDAPCIRCLMVAFSLLVSLSGALCVLLDKDWFTTISPSTKVPMYVMLSCSLTFSISFVLVDLLNAYQDRNSYDMRRRWIIHTPMQSGVVLLGATGLGASLGLMFGAMDVEDAAGSSHTFRRWRSHEKLRTERSVSLPIGVLFGGIVGAANAVLESNDDSGLGERSGLLQTDDFD